MMGEASFETSPKNNMIQDMINSNNMNSTESTIPNIFMYSVQMSIDGGVNLKVRGLTGT